jgi:hypothetical protein
MDDQLKENISKSSTWVRGAYMVLFVIIFHVIEVVVTAVILIQFGFLLFTASSNENLRELGKRLGFYLSQIVNFLTYATEEKPYPFGPWPKDSDVLLPF